MPTRIGDRFDVFVSYARADGERVEPLVCALEDAGYRVWFDRNEIDTFSSIQRSVDEGLARSTSILACFSEAYPTRRACLWELTAGYLAAQSTTEKQERVLVLNLGSSLDHVPPVLARLALPTLSFDTLDATVSATTLRLEALRDKQPLGHERRMRPRWHGSQPLSSDRFVGRLADLWAISGALAGDDAPILGERGAAGVAVVSGLGGMGKSMLVHEYAVRFGAAYPGGVYWLSSRGLDPEASTRSPAERAAQWHAELARVAASAGLASEGLDTRQLRQSIAELMSRRNATCLWVVDDLPEELSRGGFESYVAPHPLAATVVTTRSNQYRGFAPYVVLDRLGPEEGLSLLTRAREPAARAERQAAQAIVEDLGGHCLALDVAGGWLALGTESFGNYLDALNSPRSEVLEIAARIRETLPTGHGRSIVTTITRSLELLDEDGRRLAALAATLAPSRIPVELLTGATAPGLDAESDGSEWRVRATVALGELRAFGLAAGDASGYEFHPIVSRVVALSETCERLQALRISAADVVTGVLRSDRVVKEAQDFARHATAVLPHLPPRRGAELAGSLARLANGVGQVERSLELMRQMIDLLDSAGAERDELRGAEIRLAQAHYARCVGHPDEAEAIAELVALARAILSENDAGAPLAISARRMYTMMLLDTGRPSEAEEILKPLVRAAMRGDGTDEQVNLLNMDLATAIQVQARDSDVADRAARLNLALELEASVLSYFRDFKGTTHSLTLAAWTNLVNTLAALWRVDDALAESSELIRAGTEGRGADDKAVLGARLSRASLLSQAGDRSGAVQELTGALVEARQYLSAQDGLRQSIVERLAYEHGAASEHGAAARVLSDEVDAVREIEPAGSPLEAMWLGPQIEALAAGELHQELAELARSESSRSAHGHSTRLTNLSFAALAAFQDAVSRTRTEDDAMEEERSSDADATGMDPTTPHGSLLASVDRLREKLDADVAQTSARPAGTRRKKDLDAIDEAIDLMKAGETSAARAIYERLMESEDEMVSGMAANNLGSLLSRTGDDAAQEAYRRASVSMQPRASGEGAYNLARHLLRNAGDEKEIRRHLRSALLTAREPLAATAASLLADSLRREGDLGEAIRVLRIALESPEPGARSRVANHLALDLQNSQDFAGAKEAFRAGIDSGDSPEGGAAAFNLAILCEDQDEPEEAVSAYRAALASRHPTYAGRAAFNLALLLVGRGDRAGALESALQAVEHGGEDVKANASRLVADLEQGLES